MPPPVGKACFFTQFQSCDEVIKIEMREHLWQVTLGSVPRPLWVQSFPTARWLHLSPNYYRAARGRIVQGGHCSATSCYPRAAAGLQPCTMLQRRGVGCRRGVGGGVEEKPKDRDGAVNLSVSLWSLTSLQQPERTGSWFQSWALL